MVYNLHISNILSTFASYNKAYDRGRVDQGKKYDGCQITK